MKKKNKKIRNLHAASYHYWCSNCDEPWNYGLVVEFHGRMIRVCPVCEEILLERGKVGKQMNKKSATLRRIVNWEYTTLGIAITMIIVSLWYLVDGIL